MATNRTAGASMTSAVQSGGWVSWAQLVITYDFYDLDIDLGERGRTMIYHDYLHLSIMILLRSMLF